MAFREVTVVQIRGALRRWLRGEGEHSVARAVGIDRKTARRYIPAAMELGLERSGGEERLTDDLIGQLVERVCPHRPDGHRGGVADAAQRGEADQGVGERRPHRHEDRGGQGALQRASQCSWDAPFGDGATRPR
jgi:hypothetical protein